MSNDKLLWQLTVGEFLSLMKEKEKPEEPSEYIYGLEELSKLLGRSKSIACRLKKKGLFNDVITQFGRKIIIDKKKAIEIIKNNNLCSSQRKNSKK